MFPIKLMHLSLISKFGSFMLELFAIGCNNIFKKILCFGAKYFFCLVAQLENNPKSIAQPKVFPLHRFEFAKLVLVSGIGGTLGCILPQERTLPVRKTSEIFNRHR